jgi:hypothetical protein
MQTRFLAGWKRLMMALAIASLVVAPVRAAAPVSKVQPGSSTPLISGSVGRAADDNGRGMEPVLYPRSTYVWPYSTGPVYGNVDTAHWRDAGVLHTSVGSFDLTRGVPNLPGELKSGNRLNVVGSQYFLLQVRPEALTSGTFDRMKTQITSAGGTIIAQMPVAAFIVKMTPAAFEVLRNAEAILALEPYHPAFKLSPEIGRVPLMDAVKATSSVYSLVLRLFPGESSAAVTNSLLALGGHVTASYGDKVFVDIDRSKLAAVAGLDAVYMINENLPVLSMSEEMSTTIQTGRWNNGATPYNDAGIDGGGLLKDPAVGYQADDQLLMVLDTGIQMDAADLSNTRVDPGLDVNGLPIAGHRKVAFYGTTNAFGGSGDLLGCDGATTSGVTHGHAVAVVALGNATKVPASYGAGWTAIDGGGNSWGLDGVAPKARLIAYDAQVTPLTGRCDDPTQGNIAPGDLYTSPSGGVLPDGYSKGARIVNFSWGVAANTYDTNAGDIDQFLNDYSDAMVFIAAGNTGRDTNGDRIPDPATIGAPGTAKNGITVGASQTSDDFGDPDLPNARWSRSSNGPANGGAAATPLTGRISPLLMAPGQDAGTTGLVSTYNCRSNDNGQTGPVECDVISGVSGLTATSYASAAAAGAGLLVRDYFAQGFYPDGTNTNPGNNADKVATISGALVKSILVASADWMNQPGTVASQTPTNDPWGVATPDFYNLLGNLTRKYRGNREQGFGRIQLTNALPLPSYPGTVSGLIVDDGALAASAGTAVHSTTLSTKINAGADSRTCSGSPSTSCTSDANCTGVGTCVPYSFNVCDTTQPLTVVISWMDPGAGETIVHDLNLEVTSPSGRLYLGNFFTDDSNDNSTIDAGEECTYSGLPWPPDSVAGVVDTGPWSLPAAGTGVTCTAANHVDAVNNVEAVFLSSDSRLNGIFDDPATGVNEAADNQIEQGSWTVVVKAPSSNVTAQTYSIAIAGGVCQGSSARIEKSLPSNQLAGTTLTCNDSAVVTIDDVGTGPDPIGGLTNAEVASRTKIEVVDSLGNVVDTENLSAADISSTQVTGNNLRIQTRKFLLTEGTAPDSGNGVLDVRDGQTLRVTYQDESPNGTADPNGKRVGTATVNCKPLISSGGQVFGQYGKDTFTLLTGGCEKDLRGYFTFGFPDRYMDAGELVSYTVAFQSAELGTKLVNVSVSLKSVFADADSPANCKPGSSGVCADPNRSNNTSASSGGSAVMTILDSPKTYGNLPAGQVLTPTFTIQMAPTIVGTKKIDMLIGITSKAAGKSVESLIAKRETINADEVSINYSTDFPTGGSEPSGGFDINNNEVLESPTFDPSLFPTVPGTQYGSDYVFENGVAYSDMTAGGNNTLAGLQAPWNFDTCSTGGKCSNDATGFVSGLQNTSRVPPGGTFAQWGEDKNYNGKLDGFCTGDTTIPCTQGVTTVPPPDNTLTENCNRCSGNKARSCNVNADCTSPLPNEGTCVSKGTCNFALGEDRDPQNGSLDIGWNTNGGCGWQTKGAAATGGVWHTGLIRDLSTTACIAAGNDPGRCQAYETAPLGDQAGDNEWWENLLTPVLNKVNQGVDGSGDPVYQVAITDWAWNMLVDIPDANTRFYWTFDTDINKTAGTTLYNDAGPFNLFGGNQGAISNGNAPITGGFNMFAQISKCVDTDGNGSPDHCGTAAGTLCGSDPTNIDAECTGNDISPTRGTCNAPPAQKKCTGTVANCSADASCGGTERCVTQNVICSVDADCVTAGAGTTCLHNYGNNRNGKNSCYFEGKVGGVGLAKAITPYGLAFPADDDQANGYCHRSDALDNIDKSKTCVVNSGVSTSYDSCTSYGAPYTTCNLSNHPSTAIDAFVQNNGPGRNFGIKASNGPDMAFNTLEDIDGDTGNQFRGAVAFWTREPTTSTPPTAIGYGVAIDDMVVTWKETRLDEDSHTHCGGGNALCATIESSVGGGNSTYEGNSVVNLTVTDATPYDAVHPLNDCNGDGDYTDAARHCYNYTTRSGSDVACPTVGASCAGIVGSNAGEFCYAPDSTDCNANGKLDVVVSLITDSPGETTGELAVLDQVSPGSSVYTGSAPYSTFYDSPGTLFLVQAGTAPPVIRAQYFDRNDGTGSPCKNNLQTEKQGHLEADINVTFNAGRVTVNSYAVQNVSICSLTVGTTNKTCVSNDDCVQATEGFCNTCSNLVTKPCNPVATAGTFFCTASNGICTSTAGRGDPDGFADTNETIDLSVSFANKSGVDVDDLTATLGTNSPNIECISRATIIVGALANGAISNQKSCSLLTSKACIQNSDCTVGQGTCVANYPSFRFKVANVNRTTTAQVLQAPFTITMRSNKFDALTRSSNLTLDLDLNAVSAAGNATHAFLEDFETNGLDLFTLDTLDANKRTLALSAGYRCQYNDPFGLNSNSIGETACFLGFVTDPVTGVNDWHIHTSTSGGVGRAYTGKQSVHWGVHANPTSPILDTYRFKQLDAIKTIAPINMPLGAANPELTFAQQISMIDNASGVNVTSGESPDRGVVEVQVAANGVPQGPWVKIYPYVNVYDEQGTDDFSNCLYDPTDDGNDEKSFFDPTDPNRFYGPSSTCFPEFNFVRQGQTDYRKTFDVNDIGLASDGPGYPGCAGGTCLPANTPAVISNPGTWVRPKFQLNAFAAKTIRLRFITTTIELGDTQTANLFFARGDIPFDDGWFIDDIHIDQAVTSALTLNVDTATITPIPCGACSNITPALTATPSVLSAPGQIVTLDAKNSTVDVCKNGVLQYQYWIDANVDSILGDGKCSIATGTSCTVDANCPVGQTCVLDTLLRDWVDNSQYIDAPTTTTQYGIKVRCSTDTSCDTATNSTVNNVVVTCPLDANGLLRTLRVSKPNIGDAEPDNKANITWGDNVAVQVVRGDLLTLRSSGGITNVDTGGCLLNTTGTAVSDNTAPPTGAAFYLMKSPASSFCNVAASGAFATGVATEKTGAGGSRDTDIAADPDHCSP